MEVRHGRAAWTWTYSMDIDMDMQQHSMKTTLPVSDIGAVWNREAVQAAKQCGTVGQFGIGAV